MSGFEFVFMLGYGVRVGVSVSADVSVSVRVSARTRAGVRVRASGRGGGGPGFAPAARGEAASHTSPTWRRPAPDGQPTLPTGRSPYPSPPSASSTCLRAARQGLARSAGAQIPGSGRSFPSATQGMRNWRVSGAAPTQSLDARTNPLPAHYDGWELSPVRQFHTDLSRRRERLTVARAERMAQVRRVVAA